MFEWQKHMQSESSAVLDYKDLLEFLNLRALASESSVPHTNQQKSKVDISSSKKFLPRCGPERHPLYACPKFRGMQHDTKVSTLETQCHGMGMNYLGHNHFAKSEKPHHSLLHIERTQNITSNPIVMLTGTEAVKSTPTTVAPRSEIICSHMSTCNHQGLRQSVVSACAQT
jgi:hypothetical protein